MARPLWKGYITFGLVNVPVELHTAVRDRRPRFRLLAAALEKSGRAGIAKYVMRERQHLAAVRGVGGQLLLSTLRFHDDFVATERGRSSAPASSKELTLAIQLIEGLKSEWDPTRYTDDYVKALMKVIEAKAGGAKPTKGSIPAKRATNVVDLAERLRQSLEAAKSRPAVSREVSLAQRSKMSPRPKAEKRATKPTRARSAASASRRTRKRAAA